MLSTKTLELVRDQDRPMPSTRNSPVTIGEKFLPTQCGDAQKEFPLRSISAGQVQDPNQGLPQARAVRALPCAK